VWSFSRIQWSIDWFWLILKVATEALTPHRYRWRVAGSEAANERFTSPARRCRVADSGGCHQPTLHIQMSWWTVELPPNLTLTYTDDTVAGSGGCYRTPPSHTDDTAGQRRLPTNPTPPDTDDRVVGSRGCPTNPSDTDDWVGGQGITPSLWPHRIQGKPHAIYITRFKEVLNLFSRIIEWITSLIIDSE